MCTSKRRHWGNRTQNGISCDGRQPPRMRSPHLSFMLWVFTEVTNIVPGPGFWPAPRNDLIHSTAASRQQLLMKPGHSIPKIQRLCNWSGSKLWLCVSVSLYVVEVVWLHNRVGITASYEIQKSFWALPLKDNPMWTQLRGHTLRTQSTRE